MAFNIVHSAGAGRNGFSFEKKGFSRLKQGSHSLSWRESNTEAAFASTWTLERQPEEVRFPGQTGQKITAEGRPGGCVGKWAAQDLRLSKFSLESNSHSLKMEKSRLGEAGDLPWSYREFVARLSPDLRPPRPLLSDTRQSPWLQHCLQCSLLKCLCTKSNWKPF